MLFEAPQEWSDSQKAKFLSLWNDLGIAKSLGEFELYFEEGYPVLRRMDGAYLQLNYQKGAFWQRLKSFGKQQPLAKSLGDLKTVNRVIDLSAGWGLDSLCLSGLGFPIVAIERLPIIHFASRVAYEMSAPSFKEKYKVDFGFGEGRDFISKNRKPDDSFYYDPMYPAAEVKSNGRVEKQPEKRKEMAFLAALTQAHIHKFSDQDLFLEIKSQPFRRLIVKRSPKDEPLFEKPNYSVESKLVRFDIYLGSKNSV